LTNPLLQQRSECKSARNTLPTYRILSVNMSTMFRPLALFIGMRYTRAKRRNHFISFISLTSMVGLALGVLVMILVLSVMNGFDRELRTRILGMVPHATVSSFTPLDDWQRSEEHTSELQSRPHLVCRLLLEKK